MFPQNLNVACDVAARWVSDAIEIRPLRGHGVHRIVDQDKCVKGGLSELDDTHRGETRGHIGLTSTIDGDRKAETH